MIELQRQVGVIENEQTAIASRLDQAEEDLDTVVQRIEDAGDILKGETA